MTPAWPQHGKVKWAHPTNHFWGRSLHHLEYTSSGQRLDSCTPLRVGACSFQVVHAFEDTGTELELLQYWEWNVIRQGCNNIMHSLIHELMMAVSQRHRERLVSVK